VKKNPYINLGTWSSSELDLLIRESSKIKDPGERIDFLSRRFLGTDYAGSTLIGDDKTPEIFVTDLKGVDCFTFIDYIEAMRVSASFQEFMENVRQIRYRGGIVSFGNRNHFFTDWEENNSVFVDDVTEDIGKGFFRKVPKILNERGNGTPLLPGISPSKRQIRYIPSSVLHSSVVENLRTGDYVGIYAEMQGLDVSHVGIIIKTATVVHLRHASEKYRKVVDEDFKKYLADKPGVMILRPRRVQP
jgi:hypothetical protein